MELDLLDRGHDLLDFYRGEISMRRMVLLVVHDIDRMPRTRAAVDGLDPTRRWDETNTQLALLDTRLQSLLGVMWVGGRLKGKPPPVKPYPIPSKADVRKAATKKPRVAPKALEYLNRFAPPSSHHRHRAA